MKKIIIILLILTSGICLKAQKPELLELKEEVVKQASPGTRSGYEFTGRIAVQIRSEI